MIEERNKLGCFVKGGGGFHGKHSAQSKRKMSESHRGSVAWNKGLTKETDQRVWKNAKALIGHGGYTEESKRKMRKAKLGKKRPPDVCKRIGEGHKGLPFYQDPEYRRRRSERMKGKKNPMYGRRGPKHHAWRGGCRIYPVGWTRTFKEQIRHRDAYTCQLCGIPEAEFNRRLSIHHIDYDKDNVKPENLISLCTGCHTRTNYQREKWREFFEQEYADACE